MENLEIVKTITDIKKFETLPQESPYCSEKMLAYAEKNIFRWMFRSPIQYYVLYNGDMPDIVLPVRVYDSNVAAIVGTVENYDSSSLICRNNVITQSYFHAILLKFRENGIKKLVGKHLSSEIYKELERCSNGENLRFTGNFTECVRIPLLQEEYGLWFASLSKHTKQNCRTAYNRIQKDGVSFDFNFWSMSNNSIDNPLANLQVKEHYLDLYIQRQELKYEVKRSMLSSLKKRN
jgi:hypothetical protein